jgi:hypothetical protein
MDSEAEIDKNDIIIALEYIRESGGAVSRYKFDRFFYIRLKPNVSFNTFVISLIADGLLKIDHDSSDGQTLLTDNGKKYLETNNSG